MKLRCCVCTIGSKKNPVNLSFICYIWLRGKGNGPPKSGKNTPKKISCFNLKNLYLAKNKLNGSPKQFLVCFSLFLMCYSQILVCHSTKASGYNLKKKIWSGCIILTRLCLLHVWLSLQKQFIQNHLIISHYLSPYFRVVLLAKTFNKKFNKKNNSDIFECSRSP